MGKILLFYKYIDVKKPSESVKEQRALCESLRLTGRIFIAQEGINGTLGGSEEAITEYKTWMDNHTLFSGIDFKESPGDADYFPRLQVTAKSTIVNLGIDPKEVTVKDTGIYLTPEETHALLSDKPEDLVVLDTRNNYESRVGTFKDAITPDIDNFRDFPEYIDKHLDMFKDKQVVMFCTGGIRCERATAYLNKKKIAKKVFQIQGGIHRYIEAYPDGHFRGKNYVFDARVTQKVTDDILTLCDHCKKPNDNYSNCINAQCNKQIIVCPDCITLYHNSCSDSCAEQVRTKQVPIRVIPQKFT